MSKFKNIIFGFLLSFLLINSTNAFENKILFKINNEIITSIDIFNEVKYLKAINKQFKNTNKTQVFEIAKKSLIREKIKEIELKKFIGEVKIEDKILKNVLINYFKQIQINSIEEFEKYFIKINVNPNVIKKKVTIEVLWNKLIFDKFSQNIKIDEKNIINDLKQNNKIKKFLLSEIFFNVTNNENLEKKYQEIKDKIENTDFSEAALTYSVSDSSNKGGELGWINETSMSQIIKNSLKNIDIGDYSNPIVIPGGFLILKIIDIQEVDNNFDLNEEIKRVVNKKKNEQLNQYSNIFFNKIQKNITINEL